MKVYHKQQWAHRLTEVESCTVLTLESDDQNDLKLFKAHKLYLRTMQNITELSSVGMYSTAVGTFVRHGKIKNLATIYLNTFACAYRIAIYMCSSDINFNEYICQSRKLHH